MDYRANRGFVLPEARRRYVPLRLVIAGAIVLAAVGYLVSSGLSTATVYYLTVSELQAKSEPTDKPVRVSGNVVPGSINRNGSTVRFEIADEGGSLPVVYRGVVPDIFGDEIQVVVEGRVVGGAFQATTLLAKCPSKFVATSGSGG